MDTSTAHVIPTTPGGINHRVGVLVRFALIAAALGLIATGLILVLDPTDQIGAWLQVGIGAGLALAATRPALWAGGLAAAVGTAAGLVVGHLSDYFGEGSSDIGPGAIAFTVVLLVLTSAAGIALMRSSRL